MTVLQRWKPEAREKFGVLMMTAVLLGWFAISMSVVALQIHDQGYGSGITNRHHLPDQIRDRYNIPGVTTPQELMNATSR